MLQGFADVVLESCLFQAQSDPEAVARSLVPVLSSCDSLEFADRAEVAAYAGLHLTDRFGRVFDVMCELFERGCWPLRHRGVKVLELGSGPGPGIYGASAFSRAVSDWPVGRTREVQPVTLAHMLDRGVGWAPFIHWLSEMLLVADRKWGKVRLPFHIEHTEFEGFDVPDLHRRSIERTAHFIYEEYAENDEPISMARARDYAHRSSGNPPSRYDLILAPNFLTQLDMVDRLEQELRSAMNSVTPGGIFAVLCAPGSRYKAIRARISDLAADSGLMTILDADFHSHPDPAARAIVGAQKQAFVGAVLGACDDELVDEVRAAGIPADLLGEAEFSTPDFRCLAFVDRRRPVGSYGRRRRRSEQQ
jgi:hypothetical protein